MVRASLGSHMGKPGSAYGWSGGLPRFSGFCPPLMNDRLDIISEIYLKGLLNPNKKKKKKIPTSIEWAVAQLFACCIKILADHLLKYFSYLQTDSSVETIGMKWRMLFSGKNKKTIIHL